MSRIGKKPINIPKGVEVSISGQELKVKGPKGTGSFVAHSKMILEKNDDVLTVKVANIDDKLEKSLWGTNRKLIANLIEGVNQGFSKKMEINGVGFNASASGDKSTLNVGFSHPVIFKIPAGLSVLVEKNVITIAGTDKQLVGEISAQIREIKKPEPYKGKGIKYVDEHIRRKAGKTSKK